MPRSKQRLLRTWAVAVIASAHRLIRCFSPVLTPSASPDVSRKEAPRNIKRIPASQQSQFPDLSRIVLHVKILTLLSEAVSTLVAFPATSQYIRSVGPSPPSFYPGIRACSCSSPEVYPETSSRQCRRPLASWWVLKFLVVDMPVERDVIALGIEVLTVACFGVHDGHICYLLSVSN